MARGRYPSIPFGLDRSQYLEQSVDIGGIHPYPSAAGWFDDATAPALGLVARQGANGESRGAVNPSFSCSPHSASGLLKS